MPFASIEDLKIREGRFRKSADQKHIDDLADSIFRNGLLHAPVIDDEGYILVGECRFKAIGKLFKEQKSFMYGKERVPLGQIPIIQKGQLDRLKRKEIEFEENEIRINLSWQETVWAEKEIHDLRTEQAAERGEEHTISDTAVEVNLSRPNIRKHLIIADMLNDEEVAKAKTLDEAYRIVERKVTDAYNKTLARNFRPIVGENNTLINGDLFEELEKIPDGEFDFIITDPPYGIDVSSQGNFFARKHSYRDDRDYAQQILNHIAHHGYRICKRNACCFIFCDIEAFQDVKTIFKNQGWTPFRTPLVWDKVKQGIPPWPNMGPQRSYELFAFFVKGEKQVVQAHKDILSVPIERNLKRAAQKPAMLYYEILRHWTLAGDKVIDPCCGTGPIFPAANKLHLYATGIEFDPIAVGIASQRLGEQLSDQEELPEELPEL